MRRLLSPLALLALLAPLAIAAVAPAAFAQNDASKPVANGGVFAAGWTGKVDPTEATAGLTLSSARFALDKGVYSVTTGPATSWWNPANTASGDYTVSATFNEPKFQNLNSHPHPYGIFIAGNDMGTDKQTLIYCEAYGDGTFIVRGFGPAAFQMGGRRATANPAVHKAAAVGQPVTQDIAMSVKGGKVSCSINGTVVATYDKSEVVGPGKLTSTDGVYGIRFAHNTEGNVSDFKVTKQ